MTPRRSVTTSVVRKPVTAVGRRRTRITGTVTIGHDDHELWYEVPRRLSKADPRVIDAFVVVSMIPAMRTGTDLRVEAPVSPALLDSIPRIQSILQGWYPELTAVDVMAPRRHISDDPAPTRGLATCFTGGVDSFYTLLNRRRQLSHLSYIDGIDVPLYAHESRRVVHRHITQTAYSTRTRPAFSATNIKAFVLQYGRWGDLMFGAAIVSASLISCLGRFRELVIPSGRGEEDLVAWGSHPQLDSLWSTEYLSVDHDDTTLTRMSKVKAIADDRAAQHHLRVCHRSSAAYNCGECYKCLRTMSTIEALGKLEKFRTFPTLNFEAVATTVPRNDDERRYLRENRELALSNGHTDLATAITDSLLLRNRAASEVRPPEPIG